MKWILLVTIDRDVRTLFRVCDSERLAIEELESIRRSLRLEESISAYVVFEGNVADSHNYLA